MGPGTARVREMASGDLPRVLEIEKLCFGERWSLTAFQGELANKASTYFILEDDAGETIGYAGYWLILEESHITTIAVEPGHQGTGLGELLLLTLIEHASTHGAKWITLEVRASNTVAQNLYAKYGFTSLGRRRGYYQDNGEDALIMWTENIEQPEYRTRLSERRRRLTERGTIA